MGCLEKIVAAVGMSLMTLIPARLYSADFADFFVKAQNRRIAGIEQVEVIAENFNDRSLVYTATTDGSGVAELKNVKTDVEEDVSDPGRFDLKQNYPNPWNPSTTIEFVTEKPGNVHLAIYNNIGQLVKTLVDQNLPSGKHKVMWGGTDNNGNPVSAGVYIYRLVSGDRKDTEKMTLLDGARSGIESYVVSSPSLPRMSKAGGKQDVEDNVYILTLSKDGYKTVVDTIAVEDGATLTYTIDKETGNLSFRLVEPFGNSTEGVNIFDKHGNILSVSDSEGNVVVADVADYDTLYIGDGTKIFPAKLPVYMPITELNHDRGDLNVLMKDYPMKYLICFQNPYVDVNDPNIYAYVTAWDTTLVNADSTLKNVKYLNVLPEKLNDFIDQIKNVNDNLRLAGSKHLYPMPDETNLIYREVNNQPEEATVADSLSKDPNTSIFYLSGKYIIFPGSATNDKPHKPQGPHYATKGDFNTGNWIPERTFFEEACTTITLLNGESTDDGWLWTIFGGGAAYSEFKTLMQYSGKDVIAERLIINARDNFEPGTLLKTNAIIYLPQKE